MEKIAILERIRTFILEHIPQARQMNVQNDDQLLEGGLLDSLGILDVVSFLEEEFNISASDEELTPENFQSIATMAAYVEAKINNVPVSD